MKAQIHHLFLIFMLFGLCSGCSHSDEGDALVHVTDSKVKEVLIKAFDSAGGLDQYLNIDSVTYRKKTILYLEDGSIESEVDQVHSFKLQPFVSGIITWKDSLGDHTIFYSPDKAFTSLNGQKKEGSEQQARTSFFSNYYVLFLPFKLLDPGATLTYEGTATLESGQKAEIIKSVYNPAEHENHSTSDEWYLFFDEKDGRTLANLVYHPPTYAFIENKTTTDDTPIRMNLYRQTWRTDKDRKKEYLRGEFWYSDYKFTELP